MIRLIMFFIFSFVVSISTVAIIKIVIVCMAEFFYRGKYEWSYEDVRFVLIRGSLMALAFCVLGLWKYVSVKMHLRE